MKIQWTRLASEDRSRIREYIAQHNLSAAIEMDNRIGESVSGLYDHPEKAPPGRVAGTRELVIHPRFVIVYRIVSDGIHIIRVLHTAQQWP